MSERGDKSSPASGGMSGQGDASPAPGDDALEGTPGTGENICPECGGDGQLNGRPCPHCNGTGVVIEGIGGG